MVERREDSEWTDSFTPQRRLPTDHGAFDEIAHQWPEELHDGEQAATDDDDARAFARLGGSAAAQFFGTSDEGSTAEALLNHRSSSRTGPALEPARREWSEKEQQERSEEYSRAVPEQDVPGLKASWLASFAMFLIFLLATVAAAIWALRGLLSIDPRPWSEHMIPGFNGAAALEVLLVAPVGLIPLYLLFHLIVLWRARTHGRAVLLTAHDDPRARTHGVPVPSPFKGIWASWAFLLTCLEGLLILDASMVAFALLFNRDPWLSMQKLEVLAQVPPLAWACLLVPIGACALAWWRRKIAERRKQLLISLLYADD